MKGLGKKGIALLGLMLIVVILTFWLADKVTKGLMVAEENKTEVIEVKTEGAVKKEYSDGIPSESEYMQILHEMTHQKVDAEQKWGFTPNTPEQIDKMLKILDEADYEHEKFYREALEAWKKGDFSNAVEVHNTIWNWQNGNIGKATRLLTPEEEQDYLKLRSKYVSNK